MSKKIINKKLYLLITKKIQIVLNNPEISQLLFDNTSFQKTFRELVVYCQTYESNEVVINEKTPEFIKKYEGITKIEFNEEDISELDESDFEDKLNYLNILVKNTLGKDWDEINNSSKTDHSKNSKPEEEQFQQTNQTYSNSNQHFDANKFINENNVSVDKIAENMIDAQARQLVQRDIMQNKFYKFNSRPKSIMIFKAAMLIFWFLFILSFLVITIVGYIGNGSLFSILPESALHNEKIPQNFVILFNGVQTSQMIFIFTLILFGGLSFYIIFGNIKQWKNDNVKYSFKSTMTIMMVIFFFFTFITTISSPTNVLMNWNDIFANRSIGTFNIKIGTNDFTVDNPGNYSKLLVQYIFTIIQITSVAVGVLVNIIIVNIRPKIDFDRLNQLVEKYKCDIKSGQIKPQSGNGAQDWFRGPKSPFSPY